MQLAALAAPRVGEEDEPARVGLLQEDEPHGGASGAIGRGERHRLGQGDPGPASLVEPSAEARERVGRHAGQSTDADAGGKGLLASRS